MTESAAVEDRRPELDPSLEFSPAGSPRHGLLQASFPESRRLG